MERPTIEDTRTKGGMSVDGGSVSVYAYSKLQDEYINHLEEKQKMGLKFEIHDDELEKLEKWKEAIKLIHGDYGNLTYKFGTGSGIGYTIVVHSDKTDSEIELTDYGKW